MKRDWQPLLVGFKQGWDGAYGYLDKCGEFMSSLREKFAFYPSGATPAECRLDIPEYRLVMTASPAELNLQQQGPTWGKEDEIRFLEIAEYSTQLANGLFRPFETHRNGLSQKLITYDSTLAKIQVLSLKIWGGDYEKLGKELSLQPTAKEIKFTFTTGSYEFDVHLQAVTVGVNKREHHLPAPRSSKGQSEYISRVNQSNSNSLVEPGYALMLTLDLMETSPAPGSLSELFTMLEKYKVSLLRILHEHDRSEFSHNIFRVLGLFEGG